jgi:S1-C subfamily serine protease
MSQVCRILSHPFNLAQMSQSKTKSSNIRQVQFGAEPPNYVPYETNPPQNPPPNALEQLKTTVDKLSKQLGELSDNYLNVLKRLALVENRTDIPKVVSKAAPATVSIFMDRSVGSGFWIKCKDGKHRIVTNAHVVTRPVTVRDDYGYPTRAIGLLKNSEVVLYTVSDQDKETALQGVVSKPLKSQGKYAVDLDLDIAVIEPAQAGFKLPANINPLEFADFDTAKPNIGDLVFKVGSGKGLTGSIAMGIVSRVERKGLNSVPSIQTDTSINPGDSGGPLVNMDGKVVGVNNVKIDGAEGLGFSIPAPHVKKLLKEWGYID